MRKGTWSMLLVVIAAAGLLVFTTCTNGNAPENGPEEPFSFPGVLITINAAGDSFTMGDDTYGPNPPTGITQTISYNFKMSKTEVTNAQFQEFTDGGGYSNDSYWTTDGIEQRDFNNWTQPAFWDDTDFNGSDQPVVVVSWYEAVAFCNWLSDKEGLTQAYDTSGEATLTATGYRLPTEVEWEYAAAKGASTESERIYAYGDTMICANVVCSVNPCSASHTAPVGSKSPAGDTPQGLVDMSGNVCDWCSDNSEDNVSVSGGTDRYNFVDDQTATEFVLRGGAWITSSERFFRGAYRGVNWGPHSRFRDFGFRVVRP